MPSNRLEKIRSVSLAYPQNRSLAGFYSKVLWAGIPVYAVSKSIHYNSLTYLSYFLWFLIAALLFQIIDRSRLNPGYKSFVILVIWLSICGRIFFYENMPYYDKILHFITPSLITSITYDFCIQAGVNKRALTSLFIVTGLLVAFEAFEYLLDFYGFFEFNTRGVYDGLGTMLMSPAHDTIADLFIGMLAAITAVSIKGIRTIPGKNVSEQLEAVKSQIT